MISEVFLSLMLMVLSYLWLGRIYLHVVTDVSKDYKSFLFFRVKQPRKETFLDVLEIYCR